MTDKNIQGLVERIDVTKQELEMYGFYSENTVHDFTSLLDDCKTALLQLSEPSEDLKELARDFAERPGWKNNNGFQVAHASDIAKAMVAFHKEAISALPQPPKSED